MVSNRPLAGAALESFLLREGTAGECGAASGRGGPEQARGEERGRGELGDDTRSTRLRATKEPGLPDSLTAMLTLTGEEGVLGG